MYDLEEDKYDASSTPLEQRLLHHRHQRLEHAAKPHRVVHAPLSVPRRRLALPKKPTPIPTAAAAAARAVARGKRARCVPQAGQEVRALLCKRRPSIRGYPSLAHAVAPLLVCGDQQQRRVPAMLEHLRVVVACSTPVSVLVDRGVLDERGWRVLRVRLGMLLVVLLCITFRAAVLAARGNVCRHQRVGAANLQARVGGVAVGALRHRLRRVVVALVGAAPKEGATLYGYQGRQLVGSLELEKPRNHLSANAVAADPHLVQVEHPFTDRRAPWRAESAVGDCFEERFKVWLVKPGIPQVLRIPFPHVH